MPSDPNEEDFRPFTCGISKFLRRQDGGGVDRGSFGARNVEDVEKWEPGMEIPDVKWMEGKGVAGGWDCILNGDCSHLDGGEERGW